MTKRTRRAAVSILKDYFEDSVSITVRDQFTVIEMCNRLTMEGFEAY